MISFGPPSGQPFGEFKEYYRYLTPQNVSGNPWFKPLWEMQYDCKWDGSEAGCQKYANEPLPDIERPLTSVNVFYDGAYVYAKAIDTLIRNECPAAFTDKTKLSSCLQGDKLLSYMKNLNFKGLTGNIKFDESGNLEPVFLLNQNIYKNSTHYKTEVVATWDKETNNLIIFEDKINWTPFLSGKELMDKDAAPESVCSHPCKARQFPVIQEVKCCWICRECRDNEVIVNSRLI